MTCFKPKHIIITLLVLLVLPYYGIAQDAKMELQLDNDIFNLVDQTDRYYTNGLHIAVYHPTLNRSFVNKILIGGSNFNLQTTGFTFHQGIYTPIDIYTEELQDFDRPYASTMLLGQERISVSTKNLLRVRSSINIGLIGKQAGGEFVQNFIHGLTPHSENANGWKHQISNDFLIDYVVDVNKGWIDTRYLQISTSAYGQVGTYRDLVGLSGRINLGLMDPLYSTVFGNDLQNNFTVNLFVGGNMHYMFYDATLEGGVFNENRYVLNQTDVNRNRYQTEVGIQARYKNLIFEGGRIWQNAEFINAGDHAWGYLKIGLFF